jgi:hypothetical protein
VIYLLKVYALVAVMVFSAAGFLYLTMAAVSVILPAFQRTLSGRLR